MNKRRILIKYAIFYSFFVLAFSVFGVIWNNRVIHHGSIFLPNDHLVVTTVDGYPSLLGYNSAKKETLVFDNRVLKQYSKIRQFIHDGGWFEYDYREGDGNRDINLTVSCLNGLRYEVNYKVVDHHIWTVTYKQVLPNILELSVFAAIILGLIVVIGIAVIQNAISPAKRKLGDDTVWSASATTTPVHGVALNRAHS